MRRKVGNSSIHLALEKEDFQMLHYFLKKIIHNIDIPTLESKVYFFGLFDTKSHERLINTLFKPEEARLQKENESSSEDYEKYSRQRFRDDEYKTTKGILIKCEEIEDDADLFCRSVSDGDLKLKSFLLEENDRISKNFQIEKHPKFSKIQKTFKLFGISEKYIELILFQYLRESLENFDSFLTNSMPSPMEITAICRSVGISKADLNHLGNDNSKLYKYDIFSYHSRSHKNMEILDSFWNFLMDDNQKVFGMKLVKSVEGDSQPLDSFFIPTSDKNRILSLLKGPQSTKILLYGAPGSGKTEFAKSIAQQTKTNLQKIDSFDSDKKGERRAALVAGESFASENQSILLFDEADDLLNEGGGGRFSFFGFSDPVPEKKIWMNEFLDQTKGKIIFITNEVDSIHESVLRRFDYSLEFFPADQKQRFYYWNRILDLENASQYVTKNQVEVLAQVYPAGVGGISLAVKTSIHICKANPDENFLSVVNDVMTKHTNLTRGRIQKPLLASTPYDSSLINIDSDKEALECLIDDFKRRLENPAELNLGSLCLLFHGMPGTGKTEYARYLAKHFEMELIQKRCSDLQSKWVGETEKNIANAFQEAESKNAIFFLDEADSFFRSRELAERSWESTKTNEFLTWMETFRGIFIASTNFLRDFDSAALRRFAWKGEFRPLKREDKARLLEMYFPVSFAKASFLEREEVKEIQNLTLGDFRAVWNQFRFKTWEQVSLSEILTSLRKETSYKTLNDSKIVGF